MGTKKGTETTDVGRVGWTIIVCFAIWNMLVGAGVGHTLLRAFSWLFAGTDFCWW